MGIWTPPYETIMAMEKEGGRERDEKTDGMREREREREGGGGDYVGIV